jgi:hypothetical protein
MPVQVYLAAERSPPQGAFQLPPGTYGDCPLRTLSYLTNYQIGENTYQNLFLKGKHLKMHFSKAYCTHSYYLPKPLCLIMGLTYETVSDSRERHLITPDLYILFRGG